AAAAPASWDCCRSASDETSRVERKPVSPAITTMATRATPRKASASRSPSVSPRARSPGPEGDSSPIAGQAKPVAAAEDGHDDARAGRVGLHLAAKVLHM